jgi:hypothetical protein
MLIRYLISIILGTAHLLAQDPAEIEALKKGQPKDVASFIERVFECTYYGGEEPYSKDRAREIKAATKKLHCNRLSRDEAKLRWKYRRKPVIIAAIDAAKSF